MTAAAAAVSAAAAAAFSGSAAAALPPGKQLYRELYRQVKQLPKATQLYYRNYLRQHFVNWDGERDAETLQQLHAKARTDAQWVLDKYAQQQQQQPGARR